MLSDDILVSEIKNGNEAALEVLVKRHYNDVFSYICRRTGDYHRAYDLTQEVFIKMMTSLLKTRIDEGKFTNWLLKIAVNTCRDYYRSSSFKQSERTCELFENSASTPGIISLLERKEEIKTLKDALKSLPEEQREAIILKYYHNKKFQEIAEITGSNESTAKSRVRQGLGKLSKLIIRGDKEDGRPPELEKSINN
jgi:RNA polymerase sigma-70 factor (ECF subfamily)